MTVDEYLLCRQCQLHEHVYILYVVDGWIAELWTHDDVLRENYPENKKATRRGNTIILALIDLAEKVGNLSLDQIRKS